MLAAALWLCRSLSIDPTALGWREPKAAPIPTETAKTSHTRAHACAKDFNNPSYPSSSSQSITYPFILENQPFIFITINRLAVDCDKEAESIAAKLIAEELHGKLAFSNEEAF